MDENKNAFVPHIVISISMLASIILIPMFEAYGGFFSGYDDWPFWEIISTLFEDGFEAFEYFPVIFMTCALVPCIIMLFGAFQKSRDTILFSSISGIVLMVYFLLQFIGQNELDDVFDLKWSSIGVGFWIPLVLFIVSLLKCLSIRVVNGEENPKHEKTIRVRYNGGIDTQYLLKGKIYDVVNVEEGWYRIIDENGEGYLYSPDDFEVIE